MMPDHVHLLLRIPPKMAVWSFMGYLKGKSALMIFDRHANQKYQFGNRHFRAEGYYVPTVGLNEATISKYIQDQERDDIAVDKFGVKEYEDPFTQKAPLKGRQSVEKVAFSHFFELSQVLPLAFAPGRKNLQGTKTSGASSFLTHLSSEPDGT